MQKTKRFVHENGLFLLIAITLLVFCFSEVAGVPFHPDESSILYQSKDFEAWVSKPKTLFWQPGTAMDEYRAFNPALPKYWQGAAYSLFGFRAADVNFDWNWSADWEKNLAAGSYPDMRLLVIARSSMALASWLGVLFFYFAIKTVTTKNVAAVAATFFGLDGLLLLHGRRAMSEGLLVMCMCLSLLVFLRARKYPWLVGLVVGLAVNAKHSLALLIPIGLLAILWNPDGWLFSWQEMVKKAALYLATLAAITYFLNPLIWPHPIRGGINMFSIASRQGWVEEQYKTLQQFDLLDFALDTPLKRVGGVLGHLYFAPLQFHETGNYISQTKAAETTYSASYVHNIWHNLPGGTIWFTINLTAVVFSFLEIFKHGLSTQQPLTILLISYMITLAAILLTMFLPWQRYVMPLVPFTYAWFAVFLHQVLTLKTQNAP